VLLENFMDPVHVPYAHKVLLGKPAATALGPDMGMVGKLHNKEDPGRYDAPLPSHDMTASNSVY
jgi:phenylpropionate dioxygenase-like ring-hydroxylating dioxygenase large terminal subunit